MAAQDQSVVDLLRNAMADAQELIRGEVALAKAELRQEMSRLEGAVVAFAGAALAGAAGVLLLLVTIALAISEGFGWPAWAGFAIVTVLTIVTAVVLAYVGRQRFAARRPMPLTVDTLKENAKWMRARTS